HPAAYLLPGLQVRRVEPSLAQRLQIRIIGPAEPSSGATRLQGKTGSGGDVPHPAEARVKDAPPALVRRLSAGAPRDHAPPFEQLHVNVQTDATQNIGCDLRHGVDAWNGRAGQDDYPLVSVSRGNQFLLHSLVDR